MRPNYVGCSYPESNRVIKIIYDSPQFATVRNRVVSIGAFLNFYVVFAPLEYIPTMSKRLHFFCSSFLLRHQYFFVLFRWREGPQSVISAFSLRKAGKFIDIYIYKDNCKKLHMVKIVGLFIL